MRFEDKPENLIKNNIMLKINLKKFTMTLGIINKRILRFIHNI